MAQVGSFVPAREARLGICDTHLHVVLLWMIWLRIYVHGGNETNILNHATAQSLVLLDEIGRGTTFDGLSIAQAVAEYLATDIRRGQFLPLTTTN